MTGFDFDPDCGFDQTFNVKQSSLTSEFGLRLALPPIFSGHAYPNLAATIFLSALYALGAAKRRSPTGGCAKGIPRYSETSGFHVEAWPSMDPLFVLTICPVTHGVAKATDSKHRRMREYLIVTKRSVNRTCH